MNWSWRLARISGIDLRMHWTFLLILAWVGFSHLASGAGVLGALYGIAFILALFLCVVLHEFGHAMAARMYGIPTRDITLLPIGGVARLERMPKDPKQELVVAIAGPLVNVAIAAALLAVLALMEGFGRMSAAPVAATTGMGFLANLLWINIALVVFNMLPAFPMDGGRVLRAVLAMQMNHVRATEIAARVGQVMAILFGIIGLFYNPFLLFIAIFVYLGAEAEAQQVRVRDLLEGIPAGRAMMTRFCTLAPDDTLHFAAEQLLAGAQTDFPVVDSGGLRGILLRSDLVDGLKDGDASRLVADVMSPVADVAGEHDTLEDVMQLMHEKKYSSIPVMQGDRVIGIISLENIGEMMMLRSVIGGHAPPTNRVPRRPLGSVVPPRRGTSQDGGATA